MIALTLVVFPVFTVGFVAGRTPGRAVTEPVALRGGVASAVEGTDLADRFGLSPGSLTATVTEPSMLAERGGIRDGLAASRARVPTPSKEKSEPQLGSVTVGFYRHHSAAYWAWRYRQRTGQLQAERARIKLLKQRLRQRHTVTRRVASSGYGVWDRLADCESGGNWAANTGNGFYGGLQFTLGTWTSHGGSGMPNLAGRDTQIAIAERVLADQGWAAWPACSTALGLR